MTNLELGLALVGMLILLGLDVYASVLVVRETSGPAYQLGTMRDDPSARRRAQLLLVWLLPLIGAIVVIAMHSPRRPPPSDGWGPNDPIGPSGMEHV